jgi:hypothetical protein
MATLELWKWRVTSPTTGRRDVTRHRMTAEQAQAHYIYAERVEGTALIREVPDGPRSMLTSSWLTRRDQ